jgi:hypothetical protein
MMPTAGHYRVVPFCQQQERFYFGFPLITNVWINTCFVHSIFSALPKQRKTENNNLTVKNKNN